MIMRLLKSVVIFVFSLLLITQIIGCSTSQKVKKKCRECPEFSNQIPNSHPLPFVYAGL
jgi:hypothetical protein